MRNHENEASPIVASAKGLFQVMTQGESINEFSEVDLKCDFPARDSFRESLLSRVRAMNEMKRKLDASEDLEEGQDSLMRADDLEDSDLDLLAAAQGEIQYFRDLHEGK